MPGDEENVVATAELPPGLDVQAVTANRVWGVETDDLDVSHIVAYPLLRESPRDG